MSVGKYHPDGPDGWAKVMAEMDAFEKDSVDLIEYAWAIIANGGGGDWTKESTDWQGAAARWRDQFHAWLDRFREQVKDIKGEPDGKSA